MKTRAILLLLCALLSYCGNSVWAQATPINGMVWDLANGNQNTPADSFSISPGNINGTCFYQISSWHRGPGLVAHEAESSLNSRKWRTNQNDLQAARDSGKYYYFDLQVNSAVGWGVVSVMISEIQLTLKRSSDHAPDSFQLEYEDVTSPGSWIVVGTPFTLTTDAYSNQTFPINPGIETTSGQTRRFRLLGWNADNDNATLRIVNNSYSGAATSLTGTWSVTPPTIIIPDTFCGPGSVVISGGTPGDSLYYHFMGATGGQSTAFDANGEAFVPVYMANVVIIDSMQVTCGGTTTNIAIGEEIVVLMAQGSSISASICQGDTYDFNGNLLTVEDIYVDTFASASGCDSVVTLDLTVNPVVSNNISASICQGDTYDFNGNLLTVEDIYVDTFASASGCDSVVTLDLTVNPLVTNNISASICQGDSYDFNGNLLTVEDIYVDTFASASGCDSVVTLDLTVNPVVTNTIVDTICAGSTYTFGSQTLSTSGVYIETFSTASFCDSTVTLTLTISNPASTLTIDTAACGQVVFEGQGYTTSTVLIDTFHYAGNGCDSLYRIVNITIWDNTPIQTIIQEVACDQLLFEGQLYTSSTSWTDTLLSQHGCDSLIRDISITINHSYEAQVIASICEGENYLFNGSNYTQSGEYPASFTTSNGCDSVVTLLLTVNPLPELLIDIADQPGGFCIGDRIELYASGAQDYAWWSNFDDYLGIGNTLELSVPKPFQEIWLRGTDVNGCTDSISLQILADACCYVFMPNAFSPNGDGLNDQFGAETNGNPYEFTLHIFDRTGRRIFIGYHKGDKWDGTINGAPADMGTYFYRVTGHCIDGTPIKQQGDFTLIR